MRGPQSEVTNVSIRIAEDVLEIKTKSLESNPDHQDQVAAADRGRWRCFGIQFLSHAQF
jgi:hypothetical protein